MISGGTSTSSTNTTSALPNNINNNNNNNTTTTTTTTNNTNGSNINMPLIQQQSSPSSSNSFFALTSTTPSQGVNSSVVEFQQLQQPPPQLSSSNLQHVTTVGGNSASLLPPLAKSTPVMTTTTLNSGSATNPSHHGVASSPSFVPIAPATNANHHTNHALLPSPHTSSSDHFASTTSVANNDHPKIVPSPNTSMIVSNNVTSNSSKSELMTQQARPVKPVQIGFMPPISLCVLMEQMSSKIHQHYQKQTSSSKKSPSTTQLESLSRKKELGELSSTLNSSAEEDTRKTESVLTDDKTNSQSNEATTTNANVISTSRNVPSTNQGRSRSPGSPSSLYDILNEEYHTNYTNYQELIHATNLIVEFLYGNTDLKERYHPLHSQFSSQHSPLNWVYLQSSSPLEQPPVMYSAVPRVPPSTPTASQYSTPVKTSVPRGVPARVVGSDTTPSSSSTNFKSPSAGGSSSHDPLEIPPPVFAMPKPTNGSSEASTPIRVRIAPNNNNATNPPMPEHQHISPFPIRAREDELMEDEKRKRRINKKPESGEGGDEQENRFVCYICDKSVVDKSTKYTLTSSNFSSFHEVFPQLKTPLLGESKRICANCYHKKYRNSRKKKADDRKDAISQGSSAIMSVDTHSENYEQPSYCCCVCKKIGSDDFNEANFVNHQNYRSYISNFPFISDTPTADRPLPICDVCHEKYLQAEASQERKRKMLLLPTPVDTLESLNKKLKPDTSHL